MKNLIILFIIIFSTTTIAANGDGGQGSPDSHEFCVNQAFILLATDDGSGLEADEGGTGVDANGDGGQGTEANGDGGQGGQGDAAESYLECMKK